MAKASLVKAWARSWDRQWAALTRRSLRKGALALAKTIRPATGKRTPVPGAGTWSAGVAMGPEGARRYRLYRPPGVKRGEKLPLMVMLHGCGQDAEGFAVSTRMNGIAARERFLVLYPEQDRMANPQGCWNWFDTRSSRAQGEAALILRAVEQVCLLHPADRARVAVAGLSAGASMAALLAALHPERFRAVVMHSGVPPGAAHSSLSALRAMRGRSALAHTIPLGKAADTAVAWPPLLVIHGAADHVVSARNGRAAAGMWADAAGAKEGKPRTLQRGKRHAAVVTDFKRGRGNVATLVEVARLGHAWSGGAASQPYGEAMGPDASRMAWAFAARQFGI